MNKTISIEALELKLKEQGWMNSESTIVYIEKDCVITETFTGKTYSYRIVNYVNGEQKYLFHKRQIIRGDQLDAIRNRITSFEFFGSYYPDTEEGLIKFIFEVVFKIFGYSIREEQVDLSIKMYQAMVDRKISLSDVPVGLGKTHAYLVAAIVQRYFNEVYDLPTRPIIITTSSIELQRAIVRDYLPEISEMLQVFGIISKSITSVIGIFTIFILPETKDVYEGFNSEHPFVAGFVKFMILASMGELLAQRLGTDIWKRTKGFFLKAITWGLIGVLITFMFKLFPYGITTMIDKGLLPGADGFMGKVLFGFYTSIVVNLAFGPIFMAIHRISDTLIEAFVDKEKMSLMDAVASIDWIEFIRFIVGKTIPYFWIPAHIITFLLSEDYRILFAAFLSIALGIILTFAKKKKAIQ